MLKGCVKGVDKLGISLGQVGVLFTKSTGLPKYLTSQVFFKDGFSEGFEQPYGYYQQLESTFFNLLSTWFYTLTTVPITNTKLRKDLNL